MSKPKHISHITGLINARNSANLHRENLIKCINDHPMSGRQKAVLFGWGANNYPKRIKNISDEALIKAVEKLLDSKP